MLHKSLTLIETLVILLLIAILAAIAVPKLSGYLNTSHEAFFDAVARRIDSHIALIRIKDAQGETLTLSYRQVDESGLPSEISVIFPYDEGQQSNAEQAAKFSIILDTANEPAKTTDGYREWVEYSQLQSIVEVGSEYYAYWQAKSSFYTYLNSLIGENNALAEEFDELIGAEFSDNNPGKTFIQSYQDALVAFSDSTSEVPSGAYPSYWNFNTDIDRQKFRMHFAKDISGSIGTLGDPLEHFAVIQYLYEKEDSGALASIDRNPVLRAIDPSTFKTDLSSTYPSWYPQDSSEEHKFVEDIIYATVSLASSVDNIRSATDENGNNLNIFLPDLDEFGALQFNEDGTVKTILYTNGNNGDEPGTYLADYSDNMTNTYNRLFIEGTRFDSDGTEITQFNPDFDNGDVYLSYEEYGSNTYPANLTDIYNAYTAYYTNGSSELNEEIASANALSCQKIFGSLSGLKAYLNAEGTPISYGLQNAHQWEVTSATSGQETYCIFKTPLSLGRSQRIYHYYLSSHAFLQY